MKRSSNDSDFCVRTFPNAGVAAISPVNQASIAARVGIATAARIAIMARTAGSGGVE